ncbi:VOC family protein [Stackebrandtia soli]|uniref:VOC family protein n=1 Tax=Stackebrandtia soli TaxID=1892856 RepID=UPI0039EBE042
MAQTPRQPPRQPPRNNAKATPKAARQAKPAPKAAKAARQAKAAPRAAKNVKAAKAPTPKQRAATTNARNAQHAREAQARAQAQRARAGRAGRATTRTAGRAVPRTRVSASYRGWRSWWATAEMDRLAREEDRGIGAPQPRIGMIAGMRYWSGGRLTGVFTLLLLGFFTLSIALGASSVIAGIIGFAFLGGSVALATAARAAAHFQAYPQASEPLAPVRDFTVDDLRIEDERDDELGSLDDLDRSFGGGMPLYTPAQAPPPPESAPAPEPPTGGTTNVTTAVSHSVAQPPAPTPASETSPESEPAAASEATAESETEAESPTTAPVSIPKQQTAKDVDTLDAATGPGVVDDDQAAVDAAEALAVLDVLDLDVFDRDDEDEDDEPQSRAIPALSSGAAEVLSAYVGAEEGLPAEAVRDVAATLVVSDLDRSLMFYTELLGLVEVDRASDAVLLEAGFGRVLLWQRDDAPAGGNPVMHLTFEVGDIDVAYRTLRGKGITFTHPPRSALAGAIHEVKAASFLDPDGHGLAITELKRRE